MTARPVPRMLFVSPGFLFPNNTGGRIRTTNVLRGLKGGAFHVTLLSPATRDERAQWAAQIESTCDRHVSWEPQPARPKWRRAADLARRIPVNVAADDTAPGHEAVRQALAEHNFDVVVFDFVHAAVLAPTTIRGKTVCFTHNVEAEIFARHVERAGNPLMRLVWASQHRKMLAYESASLRRFDAVVAVSERDAKYFRDQYGLTRVSTIPTGVDLDFFAWQAPSEPAADAAPTVVFTGSMDWAANVDGIRFFLAQAWPLVLERVPRARLRVVGRDPPAALVEAGRALPGVEFTGFVDDVRPHVRSAQVFVIPLRVGGGTRIKAFEAMAMGCPVVSTAIGIEGLDVEPDRHYLLRNSAAELADGVVQLLQDPAARRALSQRARECVESRFGHRVAAQVFEKICLATLGAPA